VYIFDKFKQEFIHLWNQLHNYQPDRCWKTSITTNVIWFAETGIP